MAVIEVMVGLVISVSFVEWGDKILMRSKIKLHSLENLNYSWRFNFPLYVVHED
jgi:hypothetical protein